MFSDAKSPREGNLSQIERVKTGNVGLVRRGNCFLRLDDLEIIGDACFEPVLRLRQGFVGKIDVAFGHGHEVRRRLQVEESCAHFVIDPALQVRQLSFALRECSIRLQFVCSHTSALKNRYAERGSKRECPV